MRGQFPIAMRWQEMCGCAWKEVRPGVIAFTWQEEGHQTLSSVPTPLSSQGDQPQTTREL